MGPLFNAGACDARHNGGARGLGPGGDGRLSASLAIQSDPLRSAMAGPARGDPWYRHVLSPTAPDGLVPECGVTVGHEERDGRYRDGLPRWLATL
jgi:CxxC motif-containing protein (DUF1111 family)